MQNRPEIRGIKSLLAHKLRQGFDVFVFPIPLVKTGKGQVSLIAADRRLNQHRLNLGHFTSTTF
jgi:hypothetical protein